MAVGDEAQSIYSFRGANYRNIIEFPDQFSGTTIIKLEENYRSVQPILNLTNMVIKQASDSFQKRLFTRRDGGECPALIAASNEHQQSQFVAQRILEFREEGVPLSEIVVLFRASYHSFDLELELNSRNIPFVKVGGFKFIEAAHIKDLLAHLRVLENPLDTISWTRILSLLEGIGPKTCTKVIQQFQEQENPFMYLAAYPKKAKYTMELQRLGATLEKILPLSPPEQVQQLLEYYSPFLRDKYDNYPKREQDLEQLCTITERFRDLAATIEEQVGVVIVGQHELVRQALITLLAGGNALLEGVPGLGKTMLVRTLARTIDCSFSRIQFTPDLMPADIVGTQIVAEDGTGQRSFRFEPGPIFAHLILADEINPALIEISNVYKMSFSPT